MDLSVSENEVSAKIASFAHYNSRQLPSCEAHHSLLDTVGDTSSATEAKQISPQNHHDHLRLLLMSS
ncbi:hypothetical protein CGCTS75_v004175 [Colletotrichum tropicale]|nr:hypothetical protein CGCTS75_v004175 [Colletotrichum tropicale]